jgi:rhodanese-related sulfurtransferase
MTSALMNVRRLTMTLPVVSPVEASRLLQESAVLVDVREADERRRMAIPGSLHRPARVS